MSKGKIIVVGIGPGSVQDITPAVINAVANADVVIGYKYYFQFIEEHIKEGTKCLDTGMKQEKERAREAFKYAETGDCVCVISSGDSGIYGMAPLVLEMKEEIDSDIEIEVLPGISAFQKAASLLGAPIGHDLCLISLSDLMTPWEVIDRRIEAAAYADFVSCIYNPKSKGRFWQIYRLKEIFLKHRAEDTPVGIVYQAGRRDERVEIVNLIDFEPETIDMFNIIIIGNSQSYVKNSKIITPRGYYRDKAGKENVKIGQEIMIKSFRTIESELRNPNIPIDKKWALLHAIHTTADFNMEDVFYSDFGAVEAIYNKLSKGEVKTIITDVTMVASGIRKGALERMGIEVKCYLSDSRTKDIADKNGITRTQSGIRLGVEEHPDALYVFGNAPTALMELCELIRKGKAKPVGVIGAPVGFVNVKESKYMLKSFSDIRKIIIEGRKGGSNLAATLVNSILCFDDAEQLRPGRDV